MRDGKQCDDRSKLWSHFSLFLDQSSPHLARMCQSAVCNSIIPFDIFVALQR